MQSLFRLPQRTASALLRRWLARASGHYDGLGRLGQDFPDRHDLLRITVQEDLVIDVYWKSLKIGKGPSLSLFVRGEEFAKFDCFGPMAITTLRCLPRREFGSTGFSFRNARSPTKSAGRCSRSGRISGITSSGPRVRQSGNSSCSEKRCYRCCQWRKSECGSSTWACRR